MITVLGLTAGILTTSCWAPQLVRSYRTRSTADISWLYLGVLGAGIVLWLTYGVVSRDPALVAANVATSLAVGVLALLKHRFDRSSCRGGDHVAPVASRRAA
jgi:MtN3 and saliva related transmembrane protein